MDMSFPHKQNEITFRISWSNRMTKTKAKFNGNDVRLSSVLVDNVETTLSDALCCPNFYVDDAQKLWIRGQRVGDGGFSTVHACKNYKAAVMKIYKSGKNAEALKEIASYKYLGTSNFIPKLLGSGVGPSCSFLVIERFETDLNELLRKRQISNPRSIAKDVLNSLRFMHDKGRLHLDIKPHNIFIDKLGRAVLGDLGLMTTWAISSDNARSSRCGTYSYMSVDVHRKTTPTRRSDLESLGWVLIELFGGHLAWKSAKSSEILEAKMEMKTFPENIPQCLIKFLNIIWELDYNECPDYDALSNAI